MTSPNPSAPAAAPGQVPARPPAPLPGHACVRCGADCPIEDALCESCNPLGLAQPASSQAHGTVFVAIAVGVAVLAILGRLALNGVGPFSATVASVVPADQGLMVTLSVTNDGTRGGATTCRVYDPAVTGIGPESAYLTSPRVDPGQTASFSSLVTSLGSTPHPLAVTCQGP
jgi:hypothetical protein